jgi:hypothetical protein
MEDDPFAFVWNLARTARTPCARYVNQILDADLSSPLSEARRIVLNEAGSRYVTYRTMMNPTLETHPLYADTSVAEFERLITTRTRLGSHNLAVERGRWARVPRDERRCPACDVLEDECHVLCVCPLTEPQRLGFGFTAAQCTLPALFSLDPPNLCSYVYSVMKNSAS